MRPRSVHASALCLLASLLVAGPVWSAPKPDPPPVPPPAPAPAPQPPPPVFQPPPPAEPTVVVPSGPTASQLAARRRARLRAQRRRAAQLAAAKRAREPKAAAVAPQIQTGERKPAGFSDAKSGTSKAVPFVLAGLLAGALLLGVALTPARVVPWSRVSRALDDRRQELALLGALGFVATGFFFLLAMMSSG